MNKNERKIYMRKYRKNHKGLSTPFMHKIRFGGLRNKVLKRDNYECVNCHLSQLSHRQIFGCDITIDHIDRNRNNNTFGNLMTLCKSCHGSKDGKFRRSKPIVDFNSQIL